MVFRFLNSTMKMVHGRITEHRRASLDRLFTPKARDIAQPLNRALIDGLEEAP